MRIIKLGRSPDDQSKGSKRKERISIKRLIAVRREFLEMAAESNEPIIFDFGVLRGGDTLQCLNLAEAILESSVPTIAWVRKYVGSGGVYLLIACKKRLALEDAEVHFHTPRYYVRGSWIIVASRRAILERRIKKHNARIAKVIREGHTNWTDDQIGDIVTLTKGEVHLKTALEGLKVGVITEIVDSFE